MTFKEIVAVRGTHSTECRAGLGLWKCMRLHRASKFVSREGGRGL